MIPPPSPAANNMRGAVTFGLLGCAAGHGMLTWPPNRVGGTMRRAAAGGDMDMATFANASWYTQNAHIPGKATNCGEFVTGIKCGTRDATQPWRAPGTTPVYSPCGAYCYDQGTYSAVGCTIGQSYDDDDNWEVKDGRDLPKSKRTVWTAGGAAKVAFTALFNHGGGYAYRLCPASAAAQSEACFQQHHLQFASNETTVRWTNGTEASYPALTMTSGTHPAGSHWRTIRIPSCSTTTPSICGHELLPAPCDGCCAHHCDRWHYSLMDDIAIPATLAPGDYTLSWRWDAEINHQVWQGCADVTVVAAAGTSASA